MDIPPETAMRQASMTAHEYLTEGIRRIDNEPGEGFARKHPELLAAFVRAAVADFNTTMMLMAVENAAASIAGAIEGAISDAFGKGEDGGG